MLTREIMGLLALGVLWVNAWLVVAAAFKQLRNLWTLRAELRRAVATGELVDGEVVSAGEGDRFAVRRVHQTGRALTTKGPERILFTDGPQSFDVLGGVVSTSRGEVEVAAAEPAESEVWIDATRATEAARCPSPVAFDEAYGPASRFKGHAREVEVPVERGDRVWVLGRAEDGADGPVLGPWEDRPLMVSTLDPLAWIGGRVRLIVLFVLGAVLALVAVTALALWPPPFGLISTIGGALGLVYFLAIQPLGTAVRDAVRTPARQPIGGTWRRPPAQPAAA